MTPERSHAYVRVMRTLDHVGPAKLSGAEQQRVRDAADALIFSRALLEDAAAQEALEDVERLCRALVDSDRWQQAAAMQLAEDVSQCGPTLLPDLKAA